MSDKGTKKYHKAERVQDWHETWHEACEPKSHDNMPDSNNSFSEDPIWNFPRGTSHDFSCTATRLPQLKLAVSEPGDMYEQEADQVADQVMRHDGGLRLQAPSLLKPSDPASHYRSGAGLQLRLDQQFQAMVQQYLQQQLDPEMLQTRLSQVNLSLLSEAVSHDNQALMSFTPSGLSSTQQQGPSVPAGKGSGTPRPGSPGDLLNAIIALPALSTLRQQVLDRLASDWERLSAGEKIIVSSTLAVIGAGAMGGAASNSGARQILLDQINGRTIPVPGLKWLHLEVNTERGNLMGGLHVDVGALLPSSLGFGSSSPVPMGGPPESEMPPIPFRVQRSAGADAVVKDKQAAQHIQESSVMPIVQEGLQSGKQPLDSGTRAFMEARFKHDFSQVRIHSDTRAAESAEELGALAYTIGHDVVFKSGQYQPMTQTGRSLLAHELTHVIQQSGSYPQASVGANHLNPIVQRDSIEVEVVEKPMSELTVPELIEDNLNTQEAILNNYFYALQNFETVVNSASEKESVPKGVGEIALEELNKFVIGKIIDAGLKDLPVAKEVVGLGRAIIEESENEKQRAIKAREFNNLGGFLVTQRIKIGKMHSALKTRHANIRHAEEAEYNKKDREGKKIYRDYLVWVNDQQTKMEASTHSQESLFQMIFEKWVSEATDHGKPAHVFIRLNERWEVVVAHVNAPRGQRLAEQLLRAGDGKVDLNELNVPRKVEFVPADLTWVGVDLDVNGKSVGNITANILGKNYISEFIKNMRSRGLPETSVMTGD